MRKRILLADLKTDLLTQKAPWTNVIKMYHLRQVITRSTRVTVSSELLFDHIHVSDVNNVILNIVYLPLHVVITAQSASHGHVRGPKYRQQRTKRPLIVALLTLMTIVLFMT